MGIAPTELGVLARLQSLGPWFGVGVSCVSGVCAHESAGYQIVTSQVERKDEQRMTLKRQWLSSDQYVG